MRRTINYIWQTKNRNYLEFLGGLSFQLTETLNLFGGAGSSPTEGFGSPNHRLLFALSWTEPKAKAATYTPTEPEPLDENFIVYFDFDKDNICVNCKMKNPSHGNCYHRCEEKKFFFDCIIS